MDFHNTVDRESVTNFGAHSDPKRNLDHISFFSPGRFFNDFTQILFSNGAHLNLCASLLLNCTVLFFVFL